MKRIILQNKANIFGLLFLLMTSSSLTLAQRSELYALKSNQGQANIELVKVNSLDASLVSVTDFTGLKGIAVGTSTFNQEAKQYVFWGINKQDEKRLYSVQTNDGSISAEPQLMLQANASNLVELEYDLKNQVLYGLSFDLMADKQYLVTVDLESGNTENVSEIADIEGIVTGSSTFDPNTGQYLFLAIDNTQTKYLYQVMAATGEVLGKLRVVDNISALQFDAVQNKLYGLNFKQNAIHFIELDQTTGVVTDKGAINGLSHYIMSSSVYQQDRSQFVFMGIDLNEKKRLYVVETPTADLRSDAILNDIIVELQADNTVFAAQRYGNATTTSTYTATLPKGLRLHPNPIKDKLNIDNQGHLSINELRVVDLSGKVILQTQNIQNTLDMSRFSAGVYVIEIETSEGNYQLKIVKE